MAKRKGFTLIGLLVLVAIIAVLMSILMPALQRVRKQARGVVCQANIKQWGTIFAMYTDDNNGYKWKISNGLYVNRTSGGNRYHCSSDGDIDVGTKSGKEPGYYMRRRKKRAPDFQS